MIEFATPLWFAVLPLPFALCWLMDRRTARPAPLARPALMHPQADLLARLGAEQRGTPGGRLLWLAGCLLLITAMARPQWLDPDQPASVPGRNIVIALDVSDSMRAIDGAGAAASRLDVAKRSAAAFLRRLRDARVGVTLFADDVVSYVPLTGDRALAADLLLDVEAGLAGERTALGEAIAHSVERLRGAPSQVRILVLMTDGTNTAGAISPRAAADLAKRHQVRVYTLGIGRNGAAAFPRGPVARPLITALPLDEPLLREIAAATGGRYEHASDAAAVDAVLTDIDRTETVDMDRPGMYRRGLYALPLAVALCLLLLNEWRSRGRVRPW